MQAARVHLLGYIRRRAGKVPRSSDDGTRRRRAIMLSAGQVLYDIDPRYRGRKVEVVRVEGPYAVCMCGPRKVRVRLDCIFSDGKPRRSGYSIAVGDDNLSAPRLDDT
jgi:hypothetical protein